MTAWSCPAVQNAAGTFGRTWETASVCTEVENTKNNLRDGELVLLQTRHVDESLAGFLGQYLAVYSSVTNLYMSDGRPGLAERPHPAQT